MDLGEVDTEAEGIPKPPPLPMPAPDPVQEGWWLDPFIPGSDQVRYYDGTDWTEFVSMIMFRGPRWVVRRPKTPDGGWARLDKNMSYATNRLSSGDPEPLGVPTPPDDPAPLLRLASANEVGQIPEPPPIPLPTPTPLNEGWWEDPAAAGIGHMRYHDGGQWTDFVSPVVGQRPRFIFRSSVEESRQYAALVLEMKAKKAQQKWTWFSWPWVAWWVGLVFVACSFIFFSPIFSRDSWMYDWGNRIGIILGLVLLVAYAVEVARWSLRRSTKGRADRWLLLVFACSLPFFMILKVWPRVLDAFGLR